MSATDVESLRAWEGRTATQSAFIAPAPAQAMAATLDSESLPVGIGDPLPPCWHWLYFRDDVATARLGVDGHPRRGDFMPPVPLERRMWAGSRLRFDDVIRIGDQVRRESEIAQVSHKHGRSGELVIVRLCHRLYRESLLLVEEEQDIVYRAQVAARAETGVAGATYAIPEAHWSRSLQPDPVILFRYSALTFNSHRIHYDRDYAVGVEGYPGLVVQGPLTASLLLDLVRSNLPDAILATFEFRALRPLFDGQAVLLQGRREGNAVELWAVDASGALAMDARAQLQVV